MHYHAVGKWVNTYKINGFEALLSNNYGGKKSELENYADSILTSFQLQPPMTAAVAAERIREMTAISRSDQQVRAFMKRHQLKFLKCGHIPAKADNDQQHQWVETELKPVIEAARKGQVHLFFCDAAHFILQPFLCSLWWCLSCFYQSFCWQEPDQCIRCCKCHYQRSDYHCKYHLYYIRYPDRFSKITEGEICR